MSVLWEFAFIPNRLDIIPVSRKDAMFRTLRLYRLLMKYSQLNDIIVVDNSCEMISINISESQM